MTDREAEQAAEDLEAMRSRHFELHEPGDFAMRRRAGAVLMPDSTGPDLLRGAGYEDLFPGSDPAREPWRNELHLPAGLLDHMEEYRDAVPAAVPEMPEEPPAEKHGDRRVSLRKQETGPEKAADRRVSLRKREEPPEPETEPETGTGSPIRRLREDVRRTAGNRRRETAQMPGPGM